MKVFRGELTENRYYIFLTPDRSPDGSGILVGRGSPDEIEQTAGNVCP